ncbi:MAG: ribosome biogenesis GTPase Der [Actinomycetota bacterium]|nr:ribosome biogenesis GTPase Der [Actinomycetota bacterium]
MLPLVAIVGRANVGKSMLVNRIAASSEAIVDKVPGVTRDRNYIQADWRGRSFTLIDTGGLDFTKSLPMSEAVVKQVLLAVEEADAIIFVVDGLSGLLPDDNEIANILRTSNKPVLLAVNKVDDLTRDEAKYQFYELGLGEPLAISAMHGLGIGDLLDELVQFLPKAIEERREELSVAIVGRPNVGKSSILNRLLGQERAIVSEIPGTTRDAIDTLLVRDGKRYRFIDTAGLRRKGRIKEDIEYYGFVRALRTLDVADVALIILDALEGATEQDQKVGELAESRGCASIILLNKWDLVKKKSTENLILNVKYRFRFLYYAPLLCISALTGEGIGDIFPNLDIIANEYKKRISTPKLNDFIQRLLAEGYILTKRCRKLKISYVTQVGTKPPVFVFFVNHPEIVDPSYQRYLGNKIRETFGFKGCPLRLKFRKK